ncbi:GNAT family N-acetyltransferase [Streptomyces sp. AK02-01A]|uniref:GNAT family N-acetyltransferase n=1 Tax=Streptomyces sp. AK02-01A TaxID=3028648 RepID=UPI0029BADF62|nr:GNAT family N-acetyltransferase [Streptomyces sp. AK02-01A]MDX3855844.1 GNAT family N-acetyltransferase [Streptomyces sp. AK02-01A]
MNHVIRPVRADEWAKVREIRLVSLQDPAAPVAFLETYEQGLQHPDSYWRQRAAGASPKHGSRSVQFIAEAPDGTWSGSVALLIEVAGSIDFLGTTIERAQGHLVGVYVRPEQRGTGLIGELIAAALEWAWSLEEPRLARVRLYVHERNPRAQAAYRKIGFVPSGQVVPFEHDPSARELELAVDRPAEGAVSRA